MGLYSPFLIANQGSKGGGGPLSSLGGFGCTTQHSSMTHEDTQMLYHTDSQCVSEP